MSGFLSIDKPPGWTSHDVVARVRRIVGERGVGHAGTLDPAATGVLPVAVGYATRLLPYLESTVKSYVATLRFGVETDSGDRDGRLLFQSSVEHLNAAAVKVAASGFVGVQEQVPPMHSAIRVGGRRLYDLARQGEKTEIPTRQVEVHSCELVSWAAPEATLHITCAKGTYIRSLARDIGRDLGCGATLTNLVRVRVGDFHIRSSISILDLRESLSLFGWEWIAVHPDTALSDHNIVVLAPDEEERWFNGQEINRSPVRGGASVYNAEREWIGVGVFDTAEGCLRPKRVIHRDTS